MYIICKKTVQSLAVIKNKVCTKKSVESPIQKMSPDIEML